MFSNTVIDSDMFCDMSLSAQALYFHLCMTADDDGFVGNPKRIMRSVNCGEDELRLLTAKGYLIIFDSGVAVITHWQEHNTIKKDRYAKTVYQDEYRLLAQSNKTYYLAEENDLETKRLHSGSETETQIREVENRIEEIREEENREESEISLSDSPLSFDDVRESFNRICGNYFTVDKLTPKRREAVAKAMLKMGEVSFDELFTRIRDSDFLTGRNNKWRGCNFDWIFKPENLEKILSGAYDNPQPNPGFSETPGRKKRNASYDLAEVTKIDTLDFI